LSRRFSLASGDVTVSHSRKLFLACSRDRRETDPRNRRGGDGGVVCSGARIARLEKQIRPFVGVTFGGGTTLLDPEKASGKPNPAIGISALAIGEVFASRPISRTRGVFQSGDSRLVLSSSVTTLTGNVMVAAPHSWTEYTLRPYFVGGAGMMRVKRQDYFDLFNIANVYAATDVGGGATGFITNRWACAGKRAVLRAISRKSQTSGSDLWYGRIIILARQHGDRHPVLRDLHR